MKTPSFCMNLDKSAASLDHQDAINERLSKASAVMVLLSAEDHWRRLNDDAVSNSLWVVRTLLSEAQDIADSMWEKQP